MLRKDEANREVFELLAPHSIVIQNYMDGVGHRPTVDHILLAIYAIQRSNGQSFTPVELKDEEQAYLRVRNVG